MADGFRITMDNSSMPSSGIVHVPDNGEVQYNVTNGTLEMWNGDEWQTVSEASFTNNEERDNPWTIESFTHVMGGALEDDNADPHVIIPMIRQVYPELLAEEIVGVQPMTDEHTGIFRAIRDFNHVEWSVELEDPEMDEDEAYSYRLGVDDLPEDLSTETLRVSG